MRNKSHVLVTLLSRECLYRGNWRSILSVRYYVLLSPWVATLSHTQSSGYVPPLRLPRLKPKESRDPVICVVNTLIATEASALLELFIY